MGHAFLQVNSVLDLQLIYFIGEKIKKNIG
jgi:hypothetical protein